MHPRCRRTWCSRSDRPVPTDFQSTVIPTDHALRHCHSDRPTGVEEPAVAFSRRLGHQSIARPLIVSRLALKPVSTQVCPRGIIRSISAILFAVPVLQLRFPSNRFYNILIILEPDQSIAVVIRAESFVFLPLALEDSLSKVALSTDVERGCGLQRCRSCRGFHPLQKGIHRALDWLRRRSASNEAGAKDNCRFLHSLRSVGMTALGDGTNCARLLWNHNSAQRI